MFFESQSPESQENYKSMLRAVGALSRLFSENNQPYIHYRVAENLFCQSFQAENLARADCSADARKDGIGVGIKTFLEKGRGDVKTSFEKVAEFNSEHSLFRNLSSEEKVRRIAELRNARIDTTCRIYGMDKMIYHCITRGEGRVSISESPMEVINIESITDIQDKGNSIAFTDGINRYSFNITKSTLLKEFRIYHRLADIPVAILENPFDLIRKVAGHAKQAQPVPQGLEEVVLPLYSERSKIKAVPEKSGLNQWNASGRTRNPDEVYIQIPAWIHKKFPNFFPKKEMPFTLYLPDGKKMSAKVCQEGSKALMSNPNSALGEWILRDVLNLKVNELLTYQRLLLVGLDSVTLYKINHLEYKIDFARTGSYEAFREASID
jgi:hypothetical protein